MLPRQRQAEYRGDYCIWLQFVDGVEGGANLERELWGKVFEPLRDKALFRQFSFDRELETIVWPNGADFAPEFVYQRLRPDYELQSEHVAAPILRRPRAGGDPVG